PGLARSSSFPSSSAPTLSKHPNLRANSPPSRIKSTPLARVTGSASTASLVLPRISCFLGGPLATVKSPPKQRLVKVKNIELEERLSETPHSRTEQSLPARQEALFRVSQAIGVYRNPKELFRVLAKELRRVVSFD